MSGWGHAVVVEGAQRLSRSDDTPATVGVVLCDAVGPYLDVAATRGAIHPARPASLFRLVRKVVQEDEIPSGMNGD
jgi:hypothetical protein